MVLFLNAFMSYLLVFVVFVAVIIAAVVIGKKLRVNKDAKLTVEELNAAEQEKTE